jgi:hypothetical protein
MENNEMGGEFSMDVGEKTPYRVFLGKPEGNRPLGRPRGRWKGNIKMNLQKVGWGT